MSGHSVNSLALPTPWKRTADFAYVRGHGPGGRDNDLKSAVPADALRLRQVVRAHSGGFSSEEASH